MILFNKKIGETPLQMLDRLRIERPELKKEKLSYAGRLDPMACGESLILIGDENKEYNNHLKYDKEYIAEFLIGVETDTFDILGLIEKIEIREHVKFNNSGFDLNIELNKSIEKILNLKEQIYPWFSSATVEGTKLFDHYRSGNTDIKRPVRQVEIKSAELLKITENSTNEIKQYIFDSIEKVQGDFRQKEILEKWQDFFDENIKQNLVDKIITFRIKLKVSSGTYIRSLTEIFPWPVTLLKLERTKVFVTDSKL